jgi:hypothetical protein
VLRKLAVAVALVVAALVVAVPAASAAGPGAGAGSGTTTPAPGNPPKATTPYYYAWYTTFSAAQKVCNDKLSQSQWRACAIQSKSGLYYVWFGL